MSSFASLSAGQTKLDRLIAPLLHANPNSSGLRLLSNNVDAFSARLASAQSAGHGLDLQYYYWKNDLTGKLLCRSVIQAADRGVRVRLLLDDINSYGYDPTYIALDSHPNIEVRLFNPCRNRAHVVQRSIELAIRYCSASRRMHNKSWIADHQLAIVGGRNIGDAYFGASENVNFRDVDLLLIGDAVSDAEKIFESYWQSPAALPIRALHKFRRPKLKKLTSRLDAVAQSPQGTAFLKLAESSSDCDRIFQSAAQFFWTPEASVIADPVEKALGQKSDSWLSRRIQKFLTSAVSDVEIVSPYFIPGCRGVHDLGAMVANGVKVSVLTNSLAATDVIAVHGAYARYRKSVISLGVTLLELKSEGVRNKSSLFGSRSASLHTKSFVVDGVKGFVGSFNLDPRSHSINTEMGVFFHHPELAAELQRIFQRQTAPQFSYRVALRDDVLHWIDARQTDIDERTPEPGARFLRRLGAALIGLLPIESQL